ncbi:hypothetical protein GA0115240_11945 [Streptomyces sp. DvalAA-14]|uniref:hypothetical protein n=1 Tax=unclassified Streptomyces TaxID=2593676 RepID=UPI00081B7103|nr:MULTISPECIES: hypothetical protein [unclassified Streptomyces]MYS20382.1 hypothetical protein [Streptomyces sp. SID4948]SCD67786.1 hypothetical protein GA0115240_11945 [Streptomyces sp. DvalAA-14]
MVRSVIERVRSNPTQFGEVEIHPRTLLSLAVDGWSAWLEEHLRPVPELMGRYGTGFPLATADLRFLRPFTFLSANAFTRETTVVFRRPRDVTVTCDTVFRRVAEDGRAGEDFAEVRLTATVSRFTPGTLCAAVLGALPAELLARLGPDERGADRRHSTLADRVAALEATAERVTADHHRTVTAHRHLCEPGDQWTFVPVPDLLAEAREALLLAEEATAPELFGTLALGHRRLTFDLHQPLGLLDSAHLTTTAYQDDTGPAFVHRITSPRGDPHALALETLRPSAALPPPPRVPESRQSPEPLGTAAPGGPPW